MPVADLRALLCIPLRHRRRAARQQLFPRDYIGSWRAIAINRRSNTRFRSNQSAMALLPGYRMTAASPTKDRSSYGSIRFPCPGFSRFVFLPEHRRHLGDHLGMTIDRSSRIKGTKLIPVNCWRVGEKPGLTEIVVASYRSNA